MVIVGPALIPVTYDRNTGIVKNHDVRILFPVDRQAHNGALSERASSKLHIHVAFRAPKIIILCFNLRQLAADRRRLQLVQEEERARR